MTPSSRTILTLMLAAVAAAGCSETGAKRPPPTYLRVLNAAPAYAAIDFYRVKRTEASGLQLGSADGFTFDSDTYSFSFHAPTPDGQTTMTIASATATLDEAHEYFAIATDDNGTGDLLIVGEPVRTGSVSLTVVNAAAGQGPFDVYFVAPGTDPATTTPVGSLAYGDDAHADSLAAGDYEVVVTDAGNAAAILFRSASITIGDGTSFLVAIAPEGGRGTVPFAVYGLTTLAGRLVDSTQPSAIRVVNAASDMLNRDLYVDADYTVPYVGDTPFGTVTSYTPIAAGARQLDVTPAGNPSVIEATLSATVEPGRYYTTFIAGNPTDGVQMPTIVEDHRPLAGLAQVRIVNAAHTFAYVDFYVVPPGTDTTTLPPVVSRARDAANTPIVSFTPGDYELVLRDQATDTIVYGPMPLTLTANTVQLLLATDAVGGSTLDVQFVDDTP